ncbi:MAG: glycoside hydrolase family 9 protein [Roseburia sp.]|nr:glycoside hydrolase family 9 protein [Roseburia sp.]
MKRGFLQSRKRMGLVWLLVFAMLCPLLPLEEKIVNADSRTYESKANFAKLLQYSLYFYDANMCGTQVSEKSLVASGKKYGNYDGYRSNCHTCDAQASYNGKTVDVSGGFHDAGDHAKFNLPQAYSAATLGLAYTEFGDAFEETGQLSHYKAIMEQFCDYFVNCTILDDAGNAVEAYCYQVGDGDADHAYWGAPEAQADRKNEAYFTSDAEPCTDIVGETAAALAIHAYNFPNDPKSLNYLSCAKKLFQYADTKPKKDSSGSKASGFYNGSSYQDDLSLAAIWLYKATEEDTYRAKYEEYTSGLNAGYLNCWDNVSVAALSYGKGWTHAKSSLDSYYNRKVCDGYTYVSPWGSARYNTALQFEGLCYDKNMGSSMYAEWAKEQMNYLLGANSTKRCYVVGYSDTSSKNPHHRAASGCASYDDFNNGRTNQKVLLGALCGGISDVSSHGKDDFSAVDMQSDSSYFYHDDMKCYVCNEVAIDYNASLVAAAAGLYAVCKADGHQMLDTDYQIDPSAVCAANQGGDETKEPEVLVPGSTTEPENTAKPTETKEPEGGVTKPETTAEPTETKEPDAPLSSGDAGNVTDASQNKTRLSKKKLTLKRGKKANVTLLGVAKKTKVKLKYPKKKLAVKLKKQTANQKQYQITGKKKGNHTVTFSIGKKKWKLKVIVK